MSAIAGVSDPTAEMPPWRAVTEAIFKPASGWVGHGLNRLLGRRAQGTLGILMYHRVTPRVPRVMAPTWNVEPCCLRRQLQGLAARGYTAWPLRRALEHNATGKPYPSGAYVVTFDDGYENLYHHAWPVLRELNVPATIFLPTAYLDSREPYPFETWSAAGSADVPAESWRPLTTVQCQEMQADGLVEFGSHTHTHADFRGRPADFLADLLTSCRELESRLQCSSPTFAFPFGRRALGFSGPPLSLAAQEAGVCCALSTESDLAAAGSTPFEWGRFTVTQADTPATLSTKLDGWYSVARSAWRQLRRPVGRHSVATPQLLELLQGSHVCVD